MPWKPIALAAPLLILALLTAGWLTACASAGKPAARLGLTQGRLAPCPDSPNCVSSQAPTTDTQHFVAPIEYSGPRDEARARLLAVLGDFPRTTLVTQNDDYIHATVRTPLFRFTDDVEFHLPADAPVIHVRSASRIGYSDLGVNRERVETLRARLAAAPPKPA